MFPRFSCFLLALLAVAPLYASTWKDCPAATEAGRFECLLDNEIALTGQLDYELALADAAREAGDLTYAAIVLERVVTRHPEQAGARFDLVIISMNIGDTPTAARHLKVLETLPNTPPVVLALITRLNQRLKPADEAFEGNLKFQGMVGVGYDTNPNLGVFADAIDLIINGSPQALVPDGSLAPQPAFFAGASAGIQYPYSPNGLLNGTVMARQYESLGDEDSVAATARVLHRLGRNSFFEGVLGDFRTSEGLYLTRAGVGVRQRMGDCRCSTIGLLLDALRGSERSSEAARVKLELETVREYGPAEFLLSTALGYDHQPEAGWGDTVGAELGADAMARFGSIKGSMGLSLYQGRDENAYSPLFGDSHRDLFRAAFRVGVSRPVAPGVEAFIDWSYSHQESGIVLFDYKRQVSALGLRLSF